MPPSRPCLNNQWCKGWTDHTSLLCQYCREVEAEAKAQRELTRQEQKQRRLDDVRKELEK